MQVQHATQTAPAERPLQPLANVRDIDPMTVHAPPKPPGGGASASGQPATPAPAGVPGHSAHPAGSPILFPTLEHTKTLDPTNFHGTGGCSQRSICNTRTAADGQYMGN